MRSEHDDGRRGVRRLALALIAGALSGCATDTTNLAPAEQLEPGGWLDVESSLASDTFAGYVEDVRGRLERFRLPLDPARAELELARAAPQELAPVAACGDEVRGIAILVHGLSDTAWAMVDMARYFAERCHVARTVLLPGHGTRAGDMLVVDHEDWSDTVRHLVDQAGREHERVVLVGFSLGAVLGLDVALDPDSPVDALVAISPAYHVSTWSYARFTPWIHLVHRWIDKGQADDAQRYEAMPTRGVAELVRAIGAMRERMDEAGDFDRPWMLVQSLDDTTTVPDENQAYVLERASDPRSRVVNFYSDQSPDESVAGVRWIPGTSERYRVNGLTHLAVHVAPDNPHYGVAADYRHCGTVDGRDPTEARRCEEAPGVAFVDWGKLPPAGGEPTALSSFNPRFDEMAAALDEFLDAIGR